MKWIKGCFSKTLVLTSDYLQEINIKTTPQNLATNNRLVLIKNSHEDNTFITYAKVSVKQTFLTP